MNGTSTSKKKKISTCSFDIYSDKSVALSRSLSPLKQRSITPPPKNQYDNNLPPKNSKYFKVFYLSYLLYFMYFRK